MTGEPFVVMTLLVRDEEDVVAHNLAYHLGMGVDHVIVTDNRSADSTRDIVLGFVESGSATLIDEPGDDFSQSRWVTRMARMASDMGASWVINGDADEFWWPTTGDIASTFASVPEDVGIVVAHRDDFVPTTGADEPFYRSMLHRKVVSRNALGRPLPPKVAHRAVPDVSVAPGNHDVSAVGLGARLDDDRLRVMHFPLRSYQQFERKIVTGGRAYERNQTLPPQVGSTWRRLYEVWKQGGLPAHYEGEEYDAARLADAVATGDLVRDVRLRDWFESRRE